MSAPLFSLRGLLDATSWADRILCVALVAGALLVPGLARPGGDGALRAVVTVGRDQVAVLPLDRDATVTVRGRLGGVTIAVEHGEVRVAASSCPQKLCVAEGAKHRPGDLIACVPNEVLVRVRGAHGTDAADGEGGVDAVTR